MYYIALYIAVPVLLVIAGQKFITPVYYKKTADGWQIKYSIINQVLTVFLLFWLIAGFLVYLYQKGGLANYKTVITILIAVLMIICVISVIDRLENLVYLTYNQSTNTIKHGSLKINVADIDDIEIRIVKDKSGSDGSEDSTLLFINLKSGRKLQLNTSARSISGTEFMYRSVIKLLVQHIDIRSSESVA